MKENFLHYLWQYQLFNKEELSSSEGEMIHIYNVGHHNQHAGPDFTEAKIQIGEQLWAGSVEIHLKSSDWYVHNHETNTSYDNVILHVVWEDDISIFRKNNTRIATLELNGLVPKQLLNSYNSLFQNKNRWIACENLIENVNDFTWNNWKERLYIERLENKSNEIGNLLNASVNDWEAVLFQLLSKNFGLKVNGEAFKTMAKTIDFSTIRKERTEAKNLEALLMGQAGVLDERLDDVYYSDLQQIYRYQKQKYKLTASYLKPQFFRLRPLNFPSIRLSQLANLFSKEANLFQQLMQLSELNEFYKLLQTQASNYWDTHYVFGKESKKSKKRITKSLIDLLLINTIIPLKFAYQKQLGKADVEALLQIIQQIKPEKNSIIQKYSDLGIEVKNAMDTQALLMLKNMYCKSQRCLDCAVGMDVLKG